jgi:hypothetical protein
MLVRKTPPQYEILADSPRHGIKLYASPSKGTVPTNVAVVGPIQGHRSVRPTMPVSGSALTH